MSNELTAIIENSSHVPSMNKKHTLSWSPMMDTKLTESEVFALKAIRKGIKGFEALCELEPCCDCCPLRNTGLCGAKNINKVLDNVSDVIDSALGGN